MKPAKLQRQWQRTDSTLEGIIAEAGMRDTAPALGWEGVWVLGLPTAWSWGLEEGIQRWVLVPEEDMAGEAGRGLCQLIYIL